MMKRFFTTRYIRLLLVALFCLMLLFAATGCGAQEDTAGKTADTDTASQSQTVTQFETPPAESVQPQQKTVEAPDSDSKIQPKDTVEDSATKTTSSDPIPQTETADPAQSKTKETSTPHEKEELICTLSVECKTILDNMDDFDPDKISVLPQDGVILAQTEVTFHKGDTAFDVLEREMQSQKIQMEFVSTPVYKSNYIEGIHNIYEFDCGPLSGWMYKVNGSFPTYGSSLYELEDGDVVEWLYSCDLGEDVGGNNITGDNQ